MNTWVWGKIEKGWYMARSGWNEGYTKYLISQGYRVEQSINKPDVK